MSNPLHHTLCPQAHIVFKPNLQQQRKCDNCTGSAIDGVFTVKYDVNRDSNAGELQVSHTPSPSVQFKASLFNLLCVANSQNQFGDDDSGLHCLFQVSDGHFVQFFAPSNLSPLPKNIVFVIDVSGSMWGVKMKQVSDSC